MPTPEFIDGGIKIVQAATVLARDGDRRALKAAKPLARCFEIPVETIDLMGAVIEGRELDEAEIEAGLKALEDREDLTRMHAGKAAETGIESFALGKTRKSIKGGPLLPRIAGGKVSLAPSVRRTVMYHAGEQHRGGAREVVKLYKECATLNEHCEALLFAADQADE